MIIRRVINAFKIGANLQRECNRSNLDLNNQCFGLFRVLTKCKISFLCPFTREKIVKRKMSCMYTYSRMDKNHARPGEGER
jgi:hypothetical protein